MNSLSLGSIVRCIRRLEELLRQMCCAAKAIGNSELEAKFTEGKNKRSKRLISMDFVFIGTQKIKRDIVFAASLYL